MIKIRELLTITHTLPIRVQGAPLTDPAIHDNITLGSTNEKNSLLFPFVEWQMYSLIGFPCSDISNDEG